MLYRGRVRKPLPWILSALFLAALFLIGAGAVNHWLEGAGFHDLLEQKSSDALHAKTSLGPLRWGWFELSSPHLEAEGLDFTSLRHLEADGVHGKLSFSDLLHGKWHVEEISLENASLHIDATRPKNNREKPLVKTASALPSWIPTLFVIDVIRAAKADVYLTLPGDKSLELLGTHLEAYPEGEETRIEGSGGVLQNPFLPDLNIETVRCRIKPSLVDLTAADLRFPQGGSLHLEGEFPDVEESTLEGRWEKVPVAALWPLLSQKITGTLEGKASIRWNPAGARSIDGTIKAHDVTLVGIPMLNEISRLTQMEAFQHLFLQQAQATFSVKGGGTTWSNIVLESQGLIKLVGGAVTQPDGTVSGDFQLGLSSPIVTVIPGAADVFSKDQHDGYFWTSLHVGGTLSHPTEDLTPRITAAVLRNAALLIQQGVKQGLQILGLDRKSLPPVVGTNNPAGNTSPVPGSNPDPAQDIKQGAGNLIDTLGGFLK